MILISGNIFISYLSKIGKVDWYAFRVKHFYTTKVPLRELYSLKLKREVMKKAKVIN
jgi:hypothetical protein